MKLYLDDDSIADELIARLRKAGHDVVVPADVGLAGASDPRHFVYAMQHDLVLLSRNAVDYGELHEVVTAAQGRHPGLLLVRADNDSTRDMSPSRIVAALAKLLRAGVPLATQVVVLNHWR